MEDEPNVQEPAYPGTQSEDLVGQDGLEVLRRHGDDVELVVLVAWKAIADSVMYENSMFTLPISPW